MPPDDHRARLVILLKRSYCEGYFIYHGQYVVGAKGCQVGPSSGAPATALTPTVTVMPPDDHRARLVKLL